MSIVFDRAVDYYDQTRALPSDLHDTMIETLVSAAGIMYDSRMLEIGIGTGRIAISTAQHVRRLFGVDLSLEMMGVLRKKLEGTALHIEIAQANALELPFEENWFDVVYAVHVYHLVHNWQNALLDARRVLKPGGRFVVNFHKREQETPNVRLRRRLKELAQAEGVDVSRPGAQTEEEILEEISKWGGNHSIVPISTTEDTEIPEKILEQLDRQIFSETWMIPRAVMDKVKPELRAWAAEQYGDLSQPIPVTYESRWLVATKS